MKRLVCIWILITLIKTTGFGQLLSWTPLFPKDNDNLEITMDATRGNLGLLNYTPVNDVYVHVGVITNLSANSTDWKYVKFVWGTTNSSAQATSLGGNKWRYTINNIRTFFGVSSGETILRVAILFRNGNGSRVQRNRDGSDMYVPVYDNSLAVRFTQPLFQPTFERIPEPISRNVGESLQLTAITNQPANLKLFLNNTEIQSATNATTISANPVLNTTGNQTIKVEATSGSVTRSESFQVYVAPPANIAPLPSGVRDGINYHADNTSVTLVLFAPGKNRVSVIGEFPGSNWMEQTTYQMNKTPDGNRWWLRINGLTPGTEYAFQYLVDGELKIAEPYAEKILDPFNDPQISSTTYPGLRSYPTGKTTGMVSVLQTNAPAYTWRNNTFNRPDKRNLVIYELLLRDFIEAHDWKTLRDTLSYLKKLGVNAIQVMPVNEFDGNDSWGYNPAFYFAPDKYYGPKNSMKQFIDSCHSNGIAVILDLVLNHATGSCPLAALYWDAANNRPAPNNPWFNVTTPHPYGLFNDFNHESPHTRQFVARVIEHWLQEYKVDGFRWDLSKGFTQNTQCGGSTTNEGCFSQYHADRVAIWKRYYDTMQAKSPGSYCILEHFAENAEERELADYGMMLWGNANYQFNEASMGWLSNSNFDSYLHYSRGWSKPHLVSYMESHDEERLMFKNLEYGNTANPSHNVKDLNTALKRMEPCAVFLLAGPGPKMIWQFGELGYEYSINRCTNGTIDPNCRLDKKPIRWDYLNQPQRKRLYNVFAGMNKLRMHPWYKDVFTANNVNINRNLGGAIKTMTLRSAFDTSIVCVLANFDVVTQSTVFSLPTAGTWYNYFTGETLTATGSGQNFILNPGDYLVLLNRNLSYRLQDTTGGSGSGGGGGSVDANISIKVYPDPVQNSSVIEINNPISGKVEMIILNSRGQQVYSVYSGFMDRGKQRIPMSGIRNHLSKGLYFIKFQSSRLTATDKFLVQ